MSKVSLQGPEVGDAQRSVERRRSVRADLLVRVDYGTIDEIFSEFTRDINEGGLFIQTEKPHPPGTEVSMSFHLPGIEEPIKTVGRVVRISPGDADTPAGMGIEFDELGASARAHIDQLVRRLRQGTKGSAAAPEPRDS